jgi:hypothetical protein
MNNFDKRVNQILNEGIGDFVGSALRAVGNFADAAKDPSKGVEAIRNALSQRKKSTEEKLGQVFSNENPPKMGQIVVTKSPVFGLGKKEKNPDYEPDILKRKPKASPKEVENANREFLSSKLVIINPNAIITGKITKQIDAKGLYGVALTDEKGNPSTKYVFAQTESAPYWQVYDATKTPDDDILVDSKGITMKLTAIMTGLGSDNASEPLKNWTDYDTYLKQLKNPKK